MNGINVVLAVLGNYIAQLEQENARLREQLQAATKAEA